MTVKSLVARRGVVAVVVGAAVVALAGVSVAEGRPVTDVRAVQARLDLITSTDRVPGAVAQVRDRYGRAVTVTSGTAELGTGRPMVGGAGRFRIASVTKPFTAVAVMQLVVRNRVRLDAPVEDYLPGVVRGTGEGSRIDGRAITVRQLLQHTSGLPDYARFLNLDDMSQPVEAAELVRIALSHKPDFRAGKGWQYSNTGFVLAGMIVERLTHKDIGTAVTELVIRPAHLRDTYWPPAGERRIRGSHAHNYTLDRTNPAGPLVDVTDVEPSWAGAAGAMVSTPTDLNLFWQRLLGGRLLPRWALAEMRTVVRAPGLGKGMFYGLGLIRVPLSCGEVWAHGGDLVGGGVANISGQDDAGRAATVYINALTGDGAAGHLLRTMDTALCG